MKLSRISNSEVNSQWELQLTAEQTHNFFVCLFIIMMPYGYFALNPIRSDTNPMNMALIPVLLLLALPRIKWLSKAEIGLLWIIAVMGSTFVFGLAKPLNMSQAIIRLGSLLIGFSYFFLASRNFFSRIDVESLLIIAYIPVLVYGTFQIFVVQTGQFAEVDTMIRTLFVSDAEIRPDRLSWFVSEASFVAFQVPLLLYLFHHRKRRILLLLLLIQLLFTKSFNVYLATVAFYVFFLLFNVAKGDRKTISFFKKIVSYILLMAIGGALAYYYIQGSPYLMARLTNLPYDRSVLERAYYIQSTLYMIIDQPFGVGIGQYGMEVANIFDKYNIPIVNWWVIPSVNSGRLDPWSTILGMIAEGGLLVIVGVALFLVRVYRASELSPLTLATFFSGLLLLFQVYPPATPYIWLTFGLIWHNWKNVQEKREGKCE